MLGTPAESKAVAEMFGVRTDTLHVNRVWHVRPGEPVVWFDRPLDGSEEYLRDIAERQGAVFVLVAAKPRRDEEIAAELETAPYFVLPGHYRPARGFKTVPGLDVAATNAVFRMARETPSKPLLVAKVIGRARLTARGAEYFPVGEG